MMVFVGCFGCVFGFCNLMLNFKIGIVIMDVVKVVEEFKGGKIIYCVDKVGNV